MIPMQCPGCSQHLQIADHFAGKTGRCDKCGAEISVPRPTAMAVAAVLPTSLIHCPDCGHEVSKRAGACPKCGAPLSEPSEPIASAQTIELTDKRLKIQLVFAVALMFGGLMVGLVVGFNAGALTTMAGLCWWLVARVAIWWHHE